MDHQTHIILVDPHPEGVGRTDDPDLAIDKLFESRFFLCTVHSGVKARDREGLLLTEEIGQLVHAALRCAVDNAGAGLFLTKELLEQVKDMALFIETGTLNDGIFEVGTFNPAFQSEKRSGLFIEKLGANILNHIRFGGRGIAEDRRHGNLLFLGNCGDGLGAVEIVRAKIMSPFRQAVRFVKYPATDLTLSYCLFDCAVAQLLGGDIEQGDIPHADLFKNRASLW